MSTISAARRRAVRRFTALTYADAFRPHGVTPSGVAPAIDDVTRLEIGAAVGSHLPDDEIAFANALVLRTVDGVSGVMAELAGDVVEAWQADGVDGVRTAMEALDREQKAELCRAFYRLIDDDGADDG
jgi:hypothetical protein